MLPQCKPGTAVGFMVKLCNQHFIAGIDQHPGNQRFVKAVIDVARSMSIAVIAERVSTPAEWDMLVLLGIDGMTGPAVRAALAGRIR